MAETQDALASLVDIVEPPLQTSLMPAPGWWFLLFIFLLVLSVSAIYLIRRRRYYQAKREAQTLLQQFSSACTTNEAAQINQLLKRVVKHYQPHHPILSASTSGWQQWLQATLPHQPLPELNSLLYKDQAIKEDISLFYQFALMWLNRYTGRSEELSGGADA